MMAAGGAVGGILSAVYGAQPIQIVFGLTCVVGGTASFILLRELRRFRTTDEGGDEVVGVKAGETQVAD
jgi:hypothetical protein